MTNSDDNNKTKSKRKELTCKLTTPELRERKATTLANLKKQILITRELKNGFLYMFPGTDSIVEELATFVKTERTCCDFFTLIFPLAETKPKPG